MYLCMTPRGFLKAKRVSKTDTRARDVKWIQAKTARPSRVVPVRIGQITPNWFGVVQDLKALSSRVNGKETTTSLHLPTSQTRPNQTKPEGLESKTPTGFNGTFERQLFFASCFFPIH